MYKVAIVGCGSIGALKPDEIDGPGSENILTHANAVDRHIKTELFAVIDPDKDQLVKAKTKWQAKRAFTSLGQMHEIDPERPEIIIIAVPTNQHINIIGNIFSGNIHPRLIIVEKPFGGNLIQANTMVELAGRYKIPIMVNYPRRYTRGYNEFKVLLDKDALGKIFNARVLYTRGLKHEGCHAIDLMNWFFGKCLDWNVGCGLGFADRNEEDMTLEVVSSFEKCSSVIFQPCDGRAYGIFEIDITAEEGRFRFIDNGLFLERYPINEANEWGHKSLDYKLTSVIRTETQLNLAMYNLISNAVNFLDDQESLICTAEDAIKIHKILDES